MTIYILGAGPTGLAIADGIGDIGEETFTIFERQKNLGGLAQTVEWDGIGAHDLGPHKIFSLDKKLILRVENLLSADKWITRDKISSIYIKGHYLPYPPSPMSLAAVFGMGVFTRMIFGFGIAKIRGLIFRSAPSTFEEDLQGRLGIPLYDIMFKPIALKLWGDPRQLDVKLSKGRVQTPSILEVLGRFLKIKNSSAFEALDFRYPKGGLQKIWDSIATKNQNKGTIRTGQTVTGFKTSKNRITHILLDEQEIKIGADDFVVSTLPVARTTQLLGDILPSPIHQLAEELVHLNDLLLVFIHVDIPSLLDESWVFVPDSDVIFHRLSEQESFDPEMTQNGSIICCEIMSSPSRDMTSKTNEELIEASLRGLADMGYRNFNTLNQKVIRLPKSYPVFRPGYEEGMNKIISTLDNIENFRSIGRQGAFNYIGTLDAMDIGYGFACWLQKRQKANWQHERERTNHYPVLD